MSDPIALGWRELQRPLQSRCPKLFYNFAPSQSSFILLLTDLVAIWQCCLDKQEICHFASEQHTSIDPSESNSQLQVLLQKLHVGLQSENNWLYHDKQIQTQAIHLTTRTNLPKPLQPLVWTFKLIPQPSAELAEHLLRPCLFEASISKQKLESLQRVIKEKDHVLSRLLEKIESLSTDLSLIFPGITGLKSRKGRVAVADAQKHVPGMKPFDLESWLSHFETDSPYASYDQKGINNLVSGCEKCPKHSVQQHQDWLRSLPEYGTQSDASIDNVAESPNTTVEEGGVSDDQSTASEDEFERQPTPPGIKRRRGGKSALSRTSSTAQENVSPPPAKKAKLGRIGGTVQRHNLSPRRSLSDKSHSSTHKEHFLQGNRRGSVTSTASETASDSGAELDRHHSNSTLKGNKPSPNKRTPPPRDPSSSQAENSAKSQKPRGNPKGPRPTSKQPSSSPPLPSNPSHINRRSQTETNPLPPTIPEHASEEDNNQQNPARLPVRTEVTASPRKLGRLKKISSTDTSHPSSPSRKPQTQSHKSTPKTKSRTTNPDDDEMDLDRDPDATPSPSPSPSHPRKPIQSRHDHTRHSSSSSTSSTPADSADPGTIKQSQQSSPPPPPLLVATKKEEEKAKEETAEEKAARRRQELKRKVDSETIGRKKRRF